MLLNHGAQVNIQDLDGRSALMKATYAQNALRVFLNLKGNSDNSIYYGYIEAVEVLLDHDAMVDLQDSLGNTALIEACYGGHTETVKILLSHNVTIDLQNHDGLSALMITSLLRYSEK